MRMSDWSSDVCSSDLYRLNVVRIQMPPLRERRDDVRLLVDYFLRKLAGSGTPKTISTSTLAALEAYHWPGNVRELENIIRRATVVAKGQAILFTDLPPEVTAAVQKATATVAPAVSTEGSPVAASGVAPGSGAAAAGNAGAVRTTPMTVPEIAQLLFRYAKADSKFKILPAVERELVIQALRETSGNQVQAAKLLGITRATLRKRVEKFGIRRELNVA
jgi:two-component system nitrogen regulation response regulator GlnG